MNENEKKTVLVTGASSGIGFDCARDFAGRGWTVVAQFFRNEKAARLLERENLLLHRVPLPVPRQDVTAATVVGGRLLVATAGHGVVWTELAELLDVDAEPWARLRSAR